jgi:hypothetical protein
MVKVQMGDHDRIQRGEVGPQGRGVVDERGC